MQVAAVVVETAIKLTSFYGNGGEQAASPGTAPMWVTLSILTTRHVWACPVCPLQKCAFLFGGSGPHLTHGSLGSQVSTQMASQSTRPFYRAHNHDLWLTDRRKQERHIGHAISVAIGCILMLSTRCCLTISSKSNLTRHRHRQQIDQLYSPGSTNVHSDLIHSTLGQTSPHSKRHLNRFSHFCRAHGRYNRQTDTHINQAMSRRL